MRPSLTAFKMTQQIPPIQTVTCYGHSFTVITTGHPSTTISAASIGATTVTVASTVIVQIGHKYVLRDAASYQNPEVVWVTGISGTTVTLASPLTIAKAASALFIDPSFNMVNRFGKMLGDPTQFTNRGVGGAVLMRGGTSSSQGGFNAVMQLHPAPPGSPTNLGDPSPGVNVCVWGVNDISLINGSTITQSAVVEANRHCARAVQARLNLTYMYDDGFSGGVSFTGSGAVVSSTTQNSGANYRTVTSTGGTATYSVLAAPTGITSRYVDMCFVGNYVGGSIPASTITFTLDGVEVFPVGSNASGPYSSTNRFSTVDVCPPITSPTGIPCVARFLIDASTHTLVATAGAGGFALDWVGLEADYAAPTIWVNCCLTPGFNGTSQNTYATAYNTMLAAVVAEFNSPHIGIADMYSTLSPAGTPITRAWLTTLDTTHPSTYGNGLVAQVMIDAYSRLSLSRAAIANL